LVAAATVLLLEPFASAQYTYPRRPYDPVMAQVQTWYERYLHRSVDPTGAKAWGDKLRSGASPLAVEAGILGSEEYYQNHASNSVGFVRGLYSDVLGERPTVRQIDIWLDRLDRCAGDRERLARRFLREVRDDK
jgi:hypothetical protein